MNRHILKTQDTDQNEFIIDNKDSCNGLQVMHFWTNTGMHLYFV